MQEFLTNNTVSCNLMSLTGYRTLVILEALLESAKSNEEINNCLLHNKYIAETFSSDTIRLYLNSLRFVGCEITRAQKSNNKKYLLTKHPFAYDIPQKQLDALKKAYKNIYDKIELSEVVAIENLFRKLADKIQNSYTREFLLGISCLKNIDKNLLRELNHYCKNNNQITVLYNSPKSGQKNIELIADKLEFKNERLYLYGQNLTHKEYSSFSVDRIMKVCGINLCKNDEKFEPQTVVYEVYDYKNYCLEADEKILEQNENKIIIEATVKNEFCFIQKILYQADNCKILKPDSIRTKLFTKLKNMGSFYGSV